MPISPPSPPEDPLVLSEAIFRTPIMVVDDIEDNRILLEELLRAEGYRTVVQAESGPDALQFMGEHRNIGLVLLDLMMPGMDGYETCRRISSSELTRHIPVIVVTGGALRRDEALLKSFACGAIDYIPKPVNEVELYGRVKSAITLFQERMRNERQTRALLESQQRYELAVNGVNDGIWDINFVTGEVYCSPKWKEMLGYDGRGGAWDFPFLKSLAHDEDREKMEAAIREHCEKKTPFYASEHRMRTQSGEFKWVFSKGRAIWDPSGRVIRMAGSTTDITHRKSLEIQLRQAQQMESIGRLAAGVAHDFNNLLTTIVGQANVGRLHLPPASPVLGVLDKIEKASLQASDFCKQMLAYAGQGCYAIERVDLNRMAAETAELVQISISKKISLVFRLSPDPLFVQADTAQLRQVLMNLILNAAEAIGEQLGSITIRTAPAQSSPADLENAVLRPSMAGLDFARLEIEDTGCGMSEEVREKIFEPFFTTKFTGRGLGLSAVLGIVKAHEGSLKVSSQAGKGTCFSLLLPRVSGGEPAVAGPAAPASAWNSSGTLLVVEDEEGVREVAEILLQELGFQVVLARDGLEGVAKFREHQDQIAAVLLDLNMPQMDGEEAFARMRQIRPDVRVILASGYSEQEAIRRFRGKGLSGFLQKPYKFKELEEKLRICLSGERLAEATPVARPAQVPEGAR